MVAARKASSPSDTGVIAAARFCVLDTRTRLPPRRPAVLNSGPPIQRASSAERAPGSWTTRIDRMTSGQSAPPQARQPATTVEQAFVGCVLTNYGNAVLRSFFPSVCSSGEIEVGGAAFLGRCFAGIACRLWPLPDRDPLVSFRASIQQPFGSQRARRGSPFNASSLVEAQLLPGLPVSADRCQPP